MKVKEEMNKILNFLIPFRHEVIVAYINGVQRVFSWRTWRGRCYDVSWYDKK